MATVEPSRIVAARRRVGLTRAELARRVGVSPALVGMWEDDLRWASEHAEELARALEVSVRFLGRHELTITEPRSVSFRKRQDALRATRDRAASWVDLAYGELLPLMREMLGPLPFPDVPDLRGTSPEAAARQLRAAWGLGEAPIKSVVTLLEAKGVRVFAANDPSPSLSAFTRWIEGEPLLFLNASIPDGCRHRFNAAHELGHLVLHRDLDYEATDARETERQADTFASSFLLSRRFLEEAPPAFRPEGFFALKPRWGASVGAMVRRMRDAGRFTEWQYENANTWLSKQGYRSNAEPQAGSMERSVLHERFVAALLGRDIDPARCAEWNDLPPALLYELMPATAQMMASLRMDGFFRGDDALPDVELDGVDPLAYYED